jgi:hypothetical protein
MNSDNMDEVDHNVDEVEQKSNLKWNMDWKAMTRTE